MLAKTKLNSMEVLISKDLIDLNIIHVEFVSINVLKEYHTKKEIKNLKTSILKDFKLCIKTMLSFYLKCRKNAESEYLRLATTKRKKQRLYHRVQCVVVKNRDLSKSKKSLGIRTPLNQIPLVGPVLF